MSSFTSVLLVVVVMLSLDPVTSRPYPPLDQLDRQLVKSCFDELFLGISKSPKCAVFYRNVNRMFLFKIHDPFTQREFMLQEAFDELLRGTCYGPSTRSDALEGMCHQYNLKSLRITCFLAIESGMKNFDCVRSFN